jgi:hypothetical protein
VKVNGEVAAVVTARGAHAALTSLADAIRSGRKK